MTIEKLEILKCQNPKPHQAKTSKVEVPMIVGARVFMKAAKNGAVFGIYATLVTNPVQTTSQLQTQYKKYQDVFEKKERMYVSSTSSL